MRSFKIALKILRTVGIFLLAVAVLSAGFVWCYLHGENYHYQDSRERDELAGSVTLLVNGASYAYMGIRPDILDSYLGVRSYNLSGMLMTMEGRCALLEEELSRNPVHTVVLEVSSDTLTRNRSEEGPHGDLPILAKLNNSGDRWRFFRTAFPISEYPDVYYDMVSCGVESAARFLTGTYSTRNRELALGFYATPKKNREIDTNYMEIYHVRSLPDEILPENVAGLRRLLQICRDHGAKPVLITTPQSRYYNYLYDNLEYFQTWFSAFAAEEKVAYYNFNLAIEKVSTIPDSLYYDENHLSPEGAEIFSALLARVLDAYFHGRDVSDWFYPSYADLEIAYPVWDA